jgi:protein TonB
VQKRIERARALAAAHQLNSAASELEAMRKISTDEVLRNVTSVMLMGIYLEEGNYVRAQSLLEEDFKQRTSGKDASLRTYFAIAGQAMNGARAHLARYRSFGINVTDASLPSEALSDLDRLSSLLERMVAQAKEIAVERKTYDALALLEDVLGIRLSLSRDGEDRAKWEVEYANAREVLASTQTQIASLGGVPSLQRANGRPAGVSPATKEPPPAIREPAAPVNTTIKETAGTSAAPDQGTTATETNGSVDTRTLNTGSLNSRASKRVVPGYPAIAKTSRTEGLVRVYVTIDETGKVFEVTSSEGPLTLRKSAEDAARQWRFPPTAIDGKPVRVSGYIEFNFAL